MIIFDREQLAWAAGFFDGEGHVRSDISPSHATSYMALNITQDYSPETLHRFNAATGNLGKVNGPYMSKSRSGLRWAYQVYGYEKCQAVISMLWPFMCDVKRKQAVNALSNASKYAKLRYGKLNPRGVRKRGNMWEARISVNGTEIRQGPYIHKQNAIMARLTMERKYNFQR